MSESSLFSEQEFPRLPALTKGEVEELSRAINNSPDLMRRVEMDPAGDQGRNKLITDAVSRDTEELYATLTPIEELRQNVHEAYTARAQNLDELNDPDF